MSRYQKGASLLPKNCFEPTTPIKTELPKSPKQPARSSNRTSTISQTEKSITRFENWKNLKNLKKSEKFLAEICDGEKEIFQETIKKWDPHKVKF